MAGYAPEFPGYVRRTATNLGINPSDLGTAISFETGGKLDHNLWGGSGGKHLGLIQFGPGEQAKYGVKPGMPLDEHFTAVENYLRDRGVKPGMGMLDLYSTINAGSPGRYNASDAANGGTPGSVADKVSLQMVGHRARANSLLGEGTEAAPANAASAPPINVTPQTGAPQGPMPNGDALDAASSPAVQAGSLDIGKLMSAIGGMKQPEQKDEGPTSVPISAAPAPGLPAAQRLAQIMQSLRS